MLLEMETEFRRIKEILESEEYKTLKILGTRAQKAEQSKTIYYSSNQSYLHGSCKDGILQTLPDFLMQLRCMCMYVCVYIYIHIHTHTCIYLYISKIYKQ